MDITVLLFQELALPGILPVDRPGFARQSKEKQNLFAE